MPYGPGPKPGEVPITLYTPILFQNLFTNKKINRCAIGFVTTDVYKRLHKDELFYEELKIFIANRLINFNEAISYEFDGLNIFIMS